jgi:hypothetical protein
MPPNSRLAASSNVGVAAGSQEAGIETIDLRDAGRHESHRRRHPRLDPRSHAAVPQGPAKDDEAASVAAAAGACEAQTVRARPHRIGWARLLRRVFDLDRQHCPNCGAGELKIIAPILERPVIRKILAHLGPDPQPPPKARAREPRPPELHFTG